MNKLLIELREYLISFAIIAACLAIGVGLQQLLAIAIPGSIVGMLVLFALLSFKVIPVKWVQPGASLFIRHMIFLFVPISVGLIAHLELLRENVLAIVLSVVTGSLLVLVAMSWSIDKLLKEKA
ncbi:CidA/LrgA family protein [Vibrio sp. WXL103]|uniref:CidA/LrgA family protein n=1 Tax=Vibrio sp. WXL103 TaxID=3450710 RepID=UPI003EC4E9C3